MQTVSRVVAIILFAGFATTAARGADTKVNSSATQAAKAPTSGSELKTGEDKAAADAAALFDSLDANHDGQLAADEIPAEKRRLFDRLLRLAGKDSTPGSKATLSRAEFIAQLKVGTETPVADGAAGAEKGSEKMPANATPADPAKMFERLDTKHAGKLSVDDVPEGRREFFKRILKQAGKNETDSLTKEEFVKVVGPILAKRAAATATTAKTDTSTKSEKIALDGDFDVEQLVKRVMQLSKRSDGKLTLADMPPRLSGRFDKIDANHDGLVDEKELRDWLTMVKQRLATAKAKN